MDAIVTAKIVRWNKRDTQLTGDLGSKDLTYLVLVEKVDLVVHGKVDRRGAGESMAELCTTQQRSSGHRERLELIA